MAVVGGVAHFVASIGLLALAVVFALQSNGGRCHDTASCVGLSLKALVLAPLSYVPACALWALVLRRIVHRCGAGTARVSSAVALQISISGTLLLSAAMAGGAWIVVGLFLASAVVPCVVSFWATGAR